MWQENIMTSLFLFQAASPSYILNSRMHNLSVASLCEVATLSLSGISRMHKVVASSQSLYIKATHINNKAQSESTQSERKEIKNDARVEHSPRLVCWRRHHWGGDWRPRWRDLRSTPSALLCAQPERRKTQMEMHLQRGGARYYRAGTDIDAQTSLMPEMPLSGCMPRGSSTSSLFVNYVLSVRVDNYWRL